MNKHTEEEWEKEFNEKLTIDNYRSGRDFKDVRDAFKVKIFIRKAIANERNKAIWKMWNEIADILATGKHDPRYHERTLKRLAIYMADKWREITN